MALLVGRRTLAVPLAVVFVVRAVRVVALASLVATLPPCGGLLHPLFARPVRAATLLVTSLVVALLLPVSPLLVRPLLGRMVLLLTLVSSLLASLGPVLTLVSSLLVLVVLLVLLVLVALVALVALLLVVTCSLVVAFLLCVPFPGPLDTLVLVGSLPVLVAPLLAARVLLVTLLLAPSPAPLRLLLSELARPSLAEVLALAVLTLLAAVLALLTLLALGLTAVVPSGLLLPVGLLTPGPLVLRRPVRLATLPPVVLAAGPAPPVVGTDGLVAVLPVGLVVDASLILVAVGRWVSVHGDHRVRARPPVAAARRPWSKPPEGGVLLPGR